MPRRHWPVLAVLGAGLLVGCSPGETAPVRSAPAEATAPDSVSLPLDQYRLTTWDTGRVILAREILVHECMRDRDADATSPPDAAAIEQDARNRIKDLGPRGNKRRYGITQPLEAATYGFHLPSTVERTARPVSAKGRPPSAHCVQQADKALEETNLATPALVREISRDSFEKSLADPSVVDALRQWSDCMKAGGYDYATPMAAMETFDLSSATVSPTEIATATADVDCKLRVGLISTWQNVESSLQQTALRGHEQALRDIAEQHDELGERVARTINGH